MTHGKIFQHRTGQENQYGNQLAQGTQFHCRGGSSPVSQIRDIETTGVSLCEGGRVCRQTGSSAGPEDSLHGQTLPKSYADVTSICSIQRTNIKRSGHTGPGGFTLQRSEAWLSRGERFEKLSWNTSLTDCQHEKSAKHTRFSFLIKLGARAMVKH